MARILVIDDRPPIPTSVARQLACWGHTVVCVGPANAAAAVLASRDVDLLVGDLRVPGMQGPALEAARAAAPGVPVLLMDASAATDPESGAAVASDAMLPGGLKVAVERAVSRMN